MTAPDENNAENVDATVDQCERVDTPNPNDVLCGRGGNINSHRGNEQFRSFVEKRKRVYLTARFKREKRLIASSIVNEIRAMDPPGRFLARKGSMKDDSGYWYDIGDEKARDKTSQALRENAPSIRAEIETEINQQRAEMRRQDTTVDPSSSAKAGSKDASYPPPPPLGHHPPNNHHAVHHPQQHAHNPPHMGHSYNHAHQSHYTQQYYDYYYHYYGYGAPPPPPPPGYPSCGAPPPPPTPPGYPPAPAPYWAGQSNANASTNATSTSTPPVTMSSAPHHSHPVGSTSASSATPSHSPPIQGAVAAAHEHSPHASSNSTQAAHSSSVAMLNQEEEDRRLAMALQQEENAKAFEDRNRRYGSDRKSSRSTAYCAPGYRPRLLNDAVEGSSVNTGSVHPKKNRPPMSASHYFGPPIVFHKENNENSHVSNHQIHDAETSATNHPAAGSNKDTNMDDQFEMDLKPEAVSRKQVNNRKDDDAIHHGHEHDTGHHDFSCSSFSSRGRLHFKDDSDIMSLFGEGDTVIPPSNGNGSTASFSRIRSMMAGKNNDSSHAFNPMTLEEEGERSHQHQQRLQERESSRSHQTNDSQHDQEQNQDSSLLSQVAHHILGNFGVGGSWKDTGSAANDTISQDKQRNSHHHGGRMESEMEMEEGQEVIMDVRDESSSMPPPHARGSGTQIDWASRAGCHTWIPDSIGYSIPSSSQFDHQDTNNRDQHGNHDSSLLQANDHSLTRQTSYSRTDISPINSMDMDFSHSSARGRQRSVSSNGRKSSNASSSLMNVFDKKNNEPNSDELLPQMHSSTLQRVPSWEPSYRSRSPVLGELSPANGMDNSLIRVNKDKLFGININTAPPTSSSEHHEDRHQHQDRHQNHHPPSPIKLSSMRGNSNPNLHHHHPEHHPEHHPSQTFNGSRDIDMDWD